MNIRCISVEWKDSCLIVKSQITYKWKPRKGITVRQPKLSTFHFRGKKIVLFIFQLQPFLLETKEPETQRVSFAQFSLVPSSVTFKGNMYPRFQEASTENIHIQKESSTSFFGTLSHKWYTEKILYLFFPMQEFQSWTTVTNYLGKVFISPSVKKSKANFPLSLRLLELLH